MRTREAVEPQRLSLMIANSTISLRARGGGRGTTPIETPGSRGIPRAVSPIETSAFLLITFLCIPLNCHRISIRMNFPYAAAKKTDGKTIRPTIPAQTLPRDSGSDRFWGAEIISATVW
ncbi:MAG: hypothetical protein PWQ30_1804 [Euryarchaeota archaeon]|nr:hypothetical protein [Euryarchaeota archaeon]